MRNDLGRGQPGGLPIELRRQLAKIAAQDDARDGRQEVAVNFRHAVGSQQEHPARFVEPPAPARLPQQVRQLRLYLVEIVRGVIVQDDQIGAEILDPPVLLRVQQVPHEGDGARVGDVDEHYGEVPGDPVTPEIGLTEDVPCDVVGARARRVRSEDA